MSCKVLFFEYGETEKQFFKMNNFDSIFDFIFLESPLNETTVIDSMQDVSMISISSKSIITEKVLEKFKNLRLISTRTIQFEHIDLNACFHRNIGVVGVEELNYSPDYLIKNSFTGMKSFLCGGKDNRVV